MNDQRPTSLRLPWRFVAAFCLFALVVAFAGYLYFIKERSRMLREENSQLSIVADLKVEQIVNWLGERRADGRRIFDNPFVPPLVQQWLNAGRDGPLSGELLRWMKAQMVSDEYDDVILLDGSGDERLAVSEGVGRQGATMKGLVSRTMETRRLVLSDLYRDEESGRIMMSMLVPLLMDRNPNGKPIAVVVLSINPNRFLFPLIQAQPTASFSSEVLLFRLEDKHVLFLNELRHLSGTALVMKRPVSRIDMPAVITALGEEGVIEGVDYRDVPVIAVTRAVPGTDWFLESKMDVDEIYRPVRQHAVIVIAMVVSLIVISGLGMLFFWRRRMADFYRRQYEAEANYRAIFNAANDAIFIHDMQTGDIIDVNQKMCDVYGWTADEARKLKAEDISSGEFPYVQTEAERFVRAAAEGTPQLFEWMSRDRSGKTFWVEVNLKRATIGGVPRVLAVVRDISERKKAEEEARKSDLLYRSLAESSEDFIFVIGKDDVVQYVNTYGARVLGVAPHEIMGKARSDLFDGMDAQRQGEGLQQVFKSGASAHIVNRTRFPSGDVWLDTRLVPLKDESGEVAAVLGLSRDITDRKRYEEQLKQYSENLELLVEARSKDLDQARAVLFSSSKLAAMGRMGAGIAHQLNSPLCGSLLLVDSLVEDCRDLHGPCDKLHSLRRSLEGMQHIIECMLSLAMISKRGGPAKTDIDLNQSINGIIEFVALELQKHDISAVTNFCPDLPLIEANVGELDQVFLNIINNAVDAMEKGGTLTVATGIVGESIEVRISDTGKGIAPDDLERIFEPFFSAQRKKRGLGLGLSIATEIVERYSGKMRVESALGKGTTFVVNLPIVAGNN